MDESPATILSPDLSDRLLRLAPINVLLFDEALICRYAAPVGDTYVGLTPRDMIGRPAADVFPPASNGLRPILELAAHGQHPWREAQYRFRQGSDEPPQHCCWSIHVDPVASPDFRGVLVSWTDMLEQDREVQSLRGQIEALRRGQEMRNAALLTVLSDLRNALTPIAGYLQVLVRRPSTFRNRSPADVIRAFVLPRIEDIVIVSDRLRQPPIYRTDDDADDRPAGP